jgi:hypothetical protein
MNIFIITSTLKPKIGIIPENVRYEQTLETIKSIKDKAPGSKIFLLDSSPTPLEQEKIDTLRKEVDYFISLFNHTHAIELGNKGLKSAAECYIMIVALDIIRNLNYGDVNRVFKITGRATLTDNFRIEDYDNPDMKGKYVFKTPVVSWMSPMFKLVDTRLWSFDYSLLDQTNQMVRDAYQDCMTGPFDLEHVYYKKLDKEKLFTKDVIGLQCVLASDGTLINE